MNTGDGCLARGFRQQGINNVAARDYLKIYGKLLGGLYGFGAHFPVGRAAVVSHQQQFPLQPFNLFRR